MDLGCSPKHEVNVLIEVTASQLNNHQIQYYFSELSGEFLAELKNQVELEQYFLKIEKLSNHIVALAGSEIIGALFYYSTNLICFITHISV